MEPNFYCINKEKANKERCKEQCHFCKKIDNNHIDIVTGEPRKFYPKEQIPNQSIFLDFVMDDGSVFRRQVMTDDKGRFFIDRFSRVSGFYFIF